MPRSFGSGLSSRPLQNVGGGAPAVREPDFASMSALLELAKKKARFTAMWAQPRRIRCACCHDVFVYLAVDTLSVEAWTFRGEGSDQRLLVEGRLKLSAEVERVEQTSGLGLALCPHCHRYQQWMVGQARWASVCVGLFVGAVVGLCSAVMHEFWRLSSSAPFDLLFAACATVLGVAGGAALGYLWALALGPGTGPQSREDRGARTESEWSAFASQHAVPAAVWFEELGRPLPQDAIFSPLAFRDEVGTRASDSADA